MRSDVFFFCILRGPRRVSKVKDGERAGEVARAAEVQRGNESLPTARRSRREGERELERREEREREPGSGGGLGEPHESQWAGKSRPGAVSAERGVDGDSLWSWGEG